MITCKIPIRIDGTANGSQGVSRRGMIGRSKKRQRQKNDVGLFLAQHLGAVRPVLEITLTRIAPRSQDDDNLIASMKAARDSVAKSLRIDDGSKLLKWVYGQEKGAPGEYALRVEIRRMEASDVQSR